MQSEPYCSRKHKGIEECTRMCRTHSTDHVSIGKRLLLMLVNIASGDASASSLYLSNRARLLDAAADFREDGYPTISNKKSRLPAPESTRSLRSNYTDAWNQDATVLCRAAVLLSRRKRRVIRHRFAVALVGHVNVRIHDSRHVGPGINSGIQLHGYPVDDAAVDDVGGS